MTAPAQITDRMPMPLFEGQAVEAVVMKISGTTPIEDGNEVIVSVDDIVLLLGEYRVVAIRHYVDPDGRLIREQVLKPMRASRHTWNPSDPDDDGVVRAGARRAP